MRQKSKSKAFSNMSGGKDSGSPFGKGVKAAYHTSKLTPMKKSKSKKKK